MAGDLKSLGASCPALAHSQKLLQGDMDLLQAHRQVSKAGQGQGTQGWRMCPHCLWAWPCPFDHR